MTTDAVWNGAGRPGAHGNRRRLLVVSLTFLGCVIAYTDRVNISVAAVAMQDRFAWSQTQKGFVLSAFFVGYLLFMFPSGLLARRFGGKPLLAVAVLAWSLFTLLTPLAAGVSIVALLAARVGMGLGEAVMFPAAYELFGRWVPPLERGRAIAVLMSGVPAGTLIGLMAAGWLVERYGWPMAFYAFGVVGLIWVIVWILQVANDPLNERRLGAQERTLLSTVRPHADATDGPPLRALLLRAPAVAIVAAHFATTWNLYLLLSWLPSYTATCISSVSPGPACSPPHRGSPRSLPAIWWGPHPTAGYAAEPTGRSFANGCNAQHS